mmetsp:Transcript_4831/g.11660  ORF Transcript_4831/g.11660 Transcript_4831/m.11660 type:complete len:87 (+) Transcript_4831:98-358(+)
MKTAARASNVRKIITKECVATAAAFCAPASYKMLSPSFLVPPIALVAQASTCLLQMAELFALCALKDHIAQTTRVEPLPVEVAERL